MYRKKQLIHGPVLEEKKELSQGLVCMAWDSGLSSALWLCVQALMLAERTDLQMQEVGIMVNRL